MNEPLALIDLLSVPGAILVITAFLAALLSTSIGAGGGLLLLGLANFMPASAVIPTHASVMLFGSLFGWNLLRESADHKVITPFVLGSIIGLGLAASFVGKLSHHTLSLILAGFLLITTWIRLPQSLTLSRHYSWQCGLVSSFLSVFVGATRPMLLTMFSKTFDDHKTVVATVNACAALQHIGKIAVFLTFTTFFLQSWPIIIFLIVLTMAGAWCGRHILGSTGQATLKMALKLMISGLAVHLILDAFGWLPWA